MASRISFSKAEILKACERSGGNVAAAARELGIRRSRLWQFFGKKVGPVVVLRNCVGLI